MIKTRDIYCSSCNPFHDHGDVGDICICPDAIHHKQLVFKYGEWIGPARIGSEEIDFNNIPPGGFFFSKGSPGSPKKKASGAVHAAKHRDPISCWGDGDNAKSGPEIKSTETGHNDDARLVRAGTATGMPGSTNKGGWYIVFDDDGWPGHQVLLGYDGSFYHRTKTTIEKWVRIN